MNIIYQCPCYCCGNFCKDWTQYGASFPKIIPYYVTCQTCTLEIAASIGYSLGWYSNGNAWSSQPYPLTEKGLQEAIATQKSKFQNVMPLTINSATVYSESACNTCGRKNDRGNPAIKVCWNCGNFL